MTYDEEAKDNLKGIINRTTKFVRDEIWNNIINKYYDTDITFSMISSVITSISTTVINNIQSQEVQDIVSLSHAIAVLAHFNSVAKDVIKTAEVWRPDHD